MMGQHIIVWNHFVTAVWFFFLSAWKLKVKKMPLLVKNSLVYRGFEVWTYVGLQEFDLAIPIYYLPSKGRMEGVKKPLSSSNGEFSRINHKCTYIVQR